MASKGTSSSFTCLLPTVNTINFPCFTKVCSDEITFSKSNKKLATLRAFSICISALNLLYKDENLAVKPPQLEKRGGAYYSDAACNLINSIYNDKGDIQVVNTLNNGSIRDFREDSAAEMSCVITKEGPKPLSIGYLPVAVSGLVAEIKAFEILAAKAAVEGDYNAALQALCINPLIPSDDLAKTILDEMMEAHKAYLPQF